eukprot:7766112-Lingulodinium_polyedra.AAC.1
MDLPNSVTAEGRRFRCCSAVSSTRRPRKHIAGGVNWNKFWRVPNASADRKHLGKNVGGRT